MASQLFFRRARNPTSAIKSLLYNISLAPKSVSISSSPFSTLSSKFSILNPKPSKPSLPVPAPKSISPFSTLSSTFSPPLPVPVDFVGKPPVAGFSYLQRSRYNTESLGFKVVAQFKLDEMKHTVYKDNIQKIRNLFPVADPSDHRFGMLRTACPILDKLPFANKFFFIEMSVESLPPLYLLVSKEMGRVVALKGGKNLVLDDKLKALKTDSFAELCGVFSAHISFKELFIPRGADIYLTLSEPAFRHSFMSISDLVLYGETVNPYHGQCFFLLNIVTIWGVVFADVFEKVSAFLKHSYAAEDGSIPDFLTSVIEAWPSISKWWFNLRGSGAPFKLMGKDYNASQLSKIVCVVDFNWLPEEDKPAFKNQYLQNLDVQRKAENEFNREISKFNQETINASKAAWDACRNGADKESFFACLEIGKAEVVEAAKNAWDRASKIYDD